MLWDLGQFFQPAQVKAIGGEVMPWGAGGMWEVQIDGGIVIVGWFRSHHCGRE